MKNESGNARAPSEKNAEEARSLSPIEEESEYAPTFFREPPGSFAISEPEHSDCDDNATRRTSKERQRMLRKMEGNKEIESRENQIRSDTDSRLPSMYTWSDSAGDSSSGDERMEPNRQLRRVKGSYCCFKAGISSRYARGEFRDGGG